jgi:hypothetical protein
MKLRIHFHLVLRLRMVDPYLHSPFVELEELKLLSTAEVGPHELVLVGLFKISYSAVYVMWR